MLKITILFGFLAIASAAYTIYRAPAFGHVAPVYHPYYAAQPYYGYSVPDNNIHTLESQRDKLLEVCRVIEANPTNYGIISDFAQQIFNFTYGALTGATTLIG